MLSPALAAIDVAITLVLGGVGVGGAWWLRRHTSLSIRNLYAPASLSVVLVGGAVAARWWPGVVALMPLSAPWVGAVAVGRRWRAADLGAGEELRNHERGRRWIWQPGPDREHRERLYLRGQGELVHERPWPHGLAYVSMTARRKYSWSTGDEQDGRPGVERRSRRRLNRAGRTRRAGSSPSGTEGPRS